MNEIILSVIIALGIACTVIALCIVYLEIKDYIKRNE